MKFIVKFEGVLEWTDEEAAGAPRDEEIKPYLDAFAAELARLVHANETVLDAEVFGTTAGRRVEVRLLVRKDDPLDVPIFSSAVVRSAFQAANVATPDWSIHWMRTEQIISDEHDDGSPRGELIPT